MGGNVRNTTLKYGSVQLSRICLIQWCVRVSTQARGKARDQDWKENVELYWGYSKIINFQFRDAGLSHAPVFPEPISHAHQKHRFFQRHLRTVLSNLLIFATGTNDSMYKDALAHTLLSGQKWAFGIYIVFMGR